MARFLDKMADEKYRLPEYTLMEELKDLLVGFQAEYAANLKMNEVGFVDQLISKVEEFEEGRSYTRE